MSEQLNRLAMASEFLGRNRDFDLVDRIQVVRGFSQLAEMEPNNEAYRLRLRKAIDDLLATVRQRKQGAALLAVLLEASGRSAGASIPPLGEGEKTLSHSARPAHLAVADALERSSGE